MPDRLQAALAYFRQEAGFSRLLPLLAAKYCGLGRLRGRVVLTALEQVEAESFTAFFRKPYYAGKRAAFSFEEFTAALEKTKFADVDILHLLSEFCGTPLLSKAEEAAQKSMHQAAVWEMLRSRYQRGLCPAWLAAVQAKQPGTKSVHLALARDEKQCLEKVQQLLAALSRLPVAYVRLAAFSQSVCGDPHALDRQSQVGKMLIDALKVVAGKQTSDAKSAVEAENELLYEFGLLRDDILNFVTCAGLAARSAVDESAEIPYFRQAFTDGAILNVPLRELLQCVFLDNARKSMGPVFIVENSGVFSSLIDLFYGKRGFLPPLLCTHGQFKLASWAAIERLAAANCAIWYSGDFDPEGLLMVQKLKSRYSAQVHLWRYTVADYARSLSKVKIDELRLKKLISITDPALQSVVAEMRQRQLAGYQEALIEDLSKDMELWLA